jgi:2-dehydro-3-deoxyphosphooctonate aldolase (KDO 8-P synthase)
LTQAEQLAQREIIVSPDVSIGNLRQLTFFGGVNVLESEDTTNHVIEHLCNIAGALRMPFVFKASFDKANRTSISGFRGPGLESALRIFQNIREKFGVPIVTDVHEPEQAALLAEVVDILQVPAMLSRQTDLIGAVCATKLPLLIKKMQVMAPEDMEFVLEKCSFYGNERVMVCERGTMFGYGNLVVDPLTFPKLKSFGYPVVFDVTHSLQMPGSLGSRSGGKSQFVESLAVAGVSQGISGVFIECHPDPKNAKCDGPSALPLSEIDDVLRRLQVVDEAVKRRLAE